MLGRMLGLGLGIELELKKIKLCGVESLLTPYKREDCFT